MDCNAANRPPGNNAGSIYCHQQLCPVPASPPAPVLVQHHHHQHSVPPQPPPNIYQFLPPAYAAILAAQHQQYAQQAGFAGPASAYPVASTSAGPEGSFTVEKQESEDASVGEMSAATATQFSTVSQIESTPHIDPETGEAVYPCPFCEKSYGGKHGRSIWRRHLSNKHGIPLHIQPRKTRWDNGRALSSSARHVDPD